MSVDHATIGQLTEEGKQMEDTVTKDTIIAMWRQELELTYGNQITELQNQLSAATQRIEQLQNVLSRSNSQLGKIIDNLTEDYFYSDSMDKEEVLEELCNILDHEPKKEIHFSATIRLDGRYDIPMADIADFDLEAFLSDTLSVDAYNGDVVIDDFTVEADEM